MSYLNQKCCWLGISTKAKWAFLVSFPRRRYGYRSFLISRIFQQSTVNMFIIKFCWWLDLNCGRLVKEWPLYQLPLITILCNILKFEMFYWDPVCSMHSHRRSSINRERLTMDWCLEGQMKISIYYDRNVPDCAWDFLKMCHSQPFFRLFNAVFLYIVDSK